MYENLSIVYDKLMDVDYDAYKNIISQELGDRKDLLVLDLGCGSGTMLPTLTKYGQVFAVDNSEQMLALASRKVPECNYFAMDLLEISNLSYEFDFVLSAFDVFNYLEDFEDFKESNEATFINIGRHDEKQKKLSRIIAATKKLNKEKYKFIRLKQIEEWGLLVRKEHKLASNKFIYPEEIKKESVIISKNKLIQNEFANWMGIPMEKLNVGATFTLVYNAAMMVKNGMGMAVCLKLENNFEDLKFIPFYKAAISKTILAWKPCLKYSVATGKFIKFIEEKRNATNF